MEFRLRFRVILARLLKCVSGLRLRLCLLFLSLATSWRLRLWVWVTFDGMSMVVIRRLRLAFRELYFGPVLRCRLVRLM